MILHELATNSLKYGALSRPEGSVCIGWRLSGDDDQELVLDWQEEGGAPAPASAREGFGTRLIRSSVTMDLAGSIDMSFQPPGLQVQIKFPLQAQVKP